MPDGLGSKFKLKSKLKLPIKREKTASIDDSKWFKKIKPEKERISKPKKNYYETDRHLYRRESSGKRNNSSSSVKDEQFHLRNRESKKGAYGDDRLRYPKKERSFGNVEAPNKDASSVERRYSRKGASIKEKGSLRGKSRNVGRLNERNSGKDDFVREKSSERVARSPSKMHTGRKDTASHKDSGKVEYRDDTVGESNDGKMRSKVRITDKREATKRFDEGDENHGLLKKRVTRKPDTRNSEEDKGFRFQMENVGKRTLTESYKGGGESDGLVKRRPETKSGSNKPAERNRIFQDRSFDEAGKKIVSHKRGLNDDSEVKDDVPRKSKRVIRIDKHDISNKRIDDSVSSSTNVKIVEKDIVVSQNAQFRAIQPSPSILSFVEDNLLGRRRLIDLRRSGYNIKLSVPLDNIPFSTSSEREHIEENVFRNKLTFFAAAKVSSSFPPADLPEIAFAGRSNVGKSSLLNALTRQWGVARTSDKPGLTQTINFFNLASKLCLVDLPGYGFAYAKEEVKDAWEELVKEYVSSRVGLKRVCLLVDTKWGMKPRDHELIALMERSKTQYQIVLTKTDVVFPINVARRAMQIEESLKSNKSVFNPVMMISSKSGAGIRSLRTVLAKIVRFAKP